MSETTIPVDIRNFLAACGGSESMRFVSRVQRNRAWRTKIGAAILRRRVSLNLTHEQLAVLMGYRRHGLFLAKVEQGLPVSPKSWDRFLARLTVALGMTKEQLEQEAAV